MRPGSAVDRYEAILAYATALSRLIGCVLLIEPVWTAARLRQPALVTMFVVLIGYSTCSAAVYWRSRRILRRHAAVDLGVYAALLLVTAAPSQAVADSNPTYDAVLLAAPGLGFVAWTLAEGAAAGCTLAVASVVGELVLAHRSSLAWNVIPAALQFPANIVIGWAIAGQARASARRIDHARRLATERAGEVARERENALVAEILRQRVLVTLDALAGGGTVADPRLREQIETDRTWLRAYISGTRPGTPELRPALRRLAATHGNRGLAVTIELPGSIPALPPDRVHALVAAAGEALTNVAKHAETGAATLAVRRLDGGVQVTVTDQGRGFHPDADTAGVGLAGSIRGRLADVGGRADVDSVPGSGTTVTLWMPT